MFLLFLEVISQNPQNTDKINISIAWKPTTHSRVAYPRKRGSLYQNVTEGSLPHPIPLHTLCFYCQFSADCQCRQWKQKRGLCPPGRGHTSCQWGRTSSKVNMQNIRYTLVWSGSYGTLKEFQGHKVTPGANLLGSPPILQLWNPETVVLSKCM